MSQDKYYKSSSAKAPFGGAYFVTYIGAAVYFVKHSHGFWAIVLALLKAGVWPAFVIYKCLGLLHV